MSIRILPLLCLFVSFSLFADAQVAKPKATTKTRTVSKVVKKAPATKNKATVNEPSQWSEADRETFIASCQAEIDWSQDSSARYCACMLGKIEKRYPKPADAEKLTSEKALELAKECIVQLSTTPGWGEKEKGEFMRECEKAAKANLGEAKAKTYCSCMMEKIQKEFPNAADVEKLKSEQIDKWAVECIGKKE